MSVYSNEEMLAGYADHDAGYPESDTDAVNVSKLCPCAVSIKKLL